MYSELEAVYPEDCSKDESDDGSTTSDSSSINTVPKQAACKSTPSSAARGSYKRRPKLAVKATPHHRIAEDETGEKYYLSRWLPAHEGDPAFVV